MCGIAGAVGAGASEDATWSQLKLLEHRGRDASGVFSRGPGSVGQTRLAVIDLVTGDPPFTSEDGGKAAVLNGEIYNYRDLRTTLIRTGHNLRSTGDTEVIAHIAESASAVELARQLDGMLAFAVWDSARNQLVLGRDRLGKKPLYYWSDGDHLVFASEVKALLVHPAVPRRLDHEALPAYLTFGYVPTPRTFFEDIRSVPPGHVLVFHPGMPPALHSYWKPILQTARAHHHISQTVAARAVRMHLSSSVERRLLSDVPIGAFLSGGIDSSSVVALMSNLMDRPVATFTIGFDNARGFDERPYARLVAKRFHTDHTEFVVKPDAAQLMERLVWHYDQPFGDSSALPTFLLSQLTREHVTVALCGDGGDELFAGYERFAAGTALSYFQMLPQVIRNNVEQAFSLVSRHTSSKRVLGVQRLLAPQKEKIEDAYLSWISSIPIQWRTLLLPDGSDWALEDFRRLWNDTAGASLLDRLLSLNLQTYLLDDLLPKADRMSMAHGLEIRSPFLDDSLVELAFSLPPSAKLRGLSLKRVLKQAVSDLLPAEILYRRKHGFGVPLEHWLRNELRTFLKGRLLDPRSRLRSYLKPEVIDRLVEEHLSSTANHGHALWALLTLEEFLIKEDW